MGERMKIFRPIIKEDARIIKKRWPEIPVLEQCRELKVFKECYHLSERDLASLFKISKSEIHRMLIVDALPETVKAAAAAFETDYHVLCLLAGSPESERKQELKSQILAGTIRRHRHAKTFMGNKAKRGPMKSQVVVDGKNQVIRCNRCLAKAPLTEILPCELKELTKLLDQWHQKHKFCSKK
jgi:hypothetical protein